jgi:flagellar hook protein FlgE
MGFQQGLSGLNAASKNLDVISNNIANVSTVGFKSSRTEFSDVYATATFGANNLQAGLGAQTVSVAQQFAQGGLSVSSNPLDVAISGNGFFRLSGESGNTYTRSGQFRMDKDGYLVTNTGENVTGYTNLTLDTSFNVVGTSNLGDIRIDLDGINAQATTDLALNVNLNSAAVPPASLATPIPFDATVPASYNYSTSVSVYDSLGTEHTVRYFFVKEDPLVTPNTWTAYAYLDNTAPGLIPAGDQMDLGGPGGGHTLSFSNTGNLTGGLTATIALDSIAINGADFLNIEMDFTGSSQYFGGSGVNSVSQNGFQSGSLVGLGIGEDGVISGRYSNGVNQPLQQLVLVTFRNPQSMVPVGQSQWVATLDAGSETINKPGEGVAGLLQASSVEDSNTDLTGELVNLIIAQRLYQANAQSITAQSTILQTLVNLR